MHMHTDSIHTHRLVQSLRLKASAIFNMEVYYMAVMQEMLVASFLFKADPSTSV